MPYCSKKAERPVRPPARHGHHIAVELIAIRLGRFPLRVTDLSVLIG
jgi:hypothetical protein